MAVELAVGYVSIVPETSKLEAGIKSAMSNAVKNADQVGADIGKRLSATASKAMRDGWKPDQDIMAGIPDTKLDRIGARIGQIIGKGVVAGLKAREAGAQFGHSFAEGAGSVGVGSLISRWRREFGGNGAMHSIGLLAGKSLSAGITAGVGVGAAGIGIALSKGFDRLVALDTAQYKLKSILKSAGRDASEVTGIVKDVTDSVTGTPFSLDQAFSTAVSAIGGGVKDIKRFMTDVADAAGFAGTDLDRIGLIFNQVQAKGKLTGEEMMQLMEAGLPAKSWIQDSYKLTSDQFENMQRDGEVTMEMLQTSIEKHAGGMSQALGNTLQGSIDNMQTALAKTGANFLSAIFGGPTGDATEGLKSAVQRVTEMLNRLNNWIVSHKDSIRQFFDAAKDAAGTLMTVLGKIINALKEHPGLIKAVAGAFVAWKAIEGIAALSTAISAISKLLRVTLPADAAIAGAGIAAGLSKALPIIGQIYAAYELGKSNPIWNPTPSTGADGSQVFTGPGGRGFTVGPDGKISLGVPSSGGGSAGITLNSGGNPIFGGGFAPTGGGMKGTSGRGFPMPWGSTSIGNAMDGVVAQPGNFAALDKIAASQFNLSMTSGFRDPNGPAISGVAANKSFHGSGRAHDFSGSPEQMLAFANFMADNYGGQLKELIFDHPGFSRTINNGAVKGPFGAYYTNNQAGPHNNHVHVAFDDGGWLLPGQTAAVNNTGKPELVMTAEQQQQVANTTGVDPSSIVHGTGAGSAPGPQSGQDVIAAADQSGLGDLLRTEGFMPANASNTGVAGTSSLAGVLNMGNQIVGTVIDTGSSLLQTAVTAAIMTGAATGSFGGAAPAAPIAAGAANYGIQMGTQALKRGVTWAYQMASIGADSLIEQLFPFGAPRWLSYDYTSLAPQLGIQQALTSTIEKQGTDVIKNAFNPQNAPAPGGGPPAPVGVVQAASADAMAGPSGPVNPATMPGAGPGPAAPAPFAAPPPGAAVDPAPVIQPTNPQNPGIGALLGLFDDGGWLPPGGMGINLTGRPEAVLSPQQWDAIAATSANPQSAAAPLVQNLYAQDMQDAIRQLQKVQNRNVMQYAGRS